MPKIRCELRRQGIVWDDYLLITSVCQSSKVRDGVGDWHVDLGVGVGVGSCLVLFVCCCDFGRDRRRYPWSCNGTAVTREDIKMMDNDADINGAIDGLRMGERSYSGAYSQCDIKETKGIAIMPAGT